ncbi:G-protein coupled receptor 37-like 1 [Aplochiton taeniatus]
MSLPLCLLWLLTLASVEGKTDKQLDVLFRAEADYLVQKDQASDLQVFQISENFPDQEQNSDLLQDSAALLDLDQQLKRVPRGAEEEEQQSTFSHSYENEFLTTPQATQLTNSTLLEAEDTNDDDDGGNSPSNSNITTSDHGNTLLYNPFYPLAEGSYSAYAVLFLGGVVLAVGVVGNMAVMCIVWNNYYMRSAWNYLLASMAFWDFLVLVFCLPVVLFNQLTNRRILGDITCRMVPYMEVTSLAITSFSLCALGIDRFHAATSSAQTKPRRVERCRSVLMKLLVIWLGSMVLSSPELLLWQLSHAVSPSTGLLLDSCSINPSSPLSLALPDSLQSLLLRYHQGRMWWCFGCYFCLPVLFTFLCQLATCNVSNDTSSSQAQRHDDRSTVANQKRQQHQAVERQLSCTVLALAVVYGLCALPEHVCNITLAYTHITVSEDTAAMLALTHQFLLFFKSSVTPVLLLCLCKALGRAFMDCCCCCCMECQPGTAQGSPGHAQVKLKGANEMASSIFFDKAKDSSAILSISTHS